MLHGDLDDVEPGESVRLMILRDGEEQAIDVTTTAYLADSGLHDFRWTGDLDDVDVDVNLADFAQHAFVRARRRGWPAAGRHRRRLGRYFGVDAGVLVLDTPAKSELKPATFSSESMAPRFPSARDAYGLLRRLDEDAQAEVRRKNRKITVNVAAASPRVEARRVLFLDGDADEVHEHEDEQDEP